MKKWKLLTLVAGVCLAGGLVSPTPADDAEAAPALTTAEVLEQGATFTTYRDPVAEMLIIKLGEEFWVGVSFDPAKPVTCIHGAARLRVFPLSEGEDGEPPGFSIEYEGPEGEEADDDEGADDQEGEAEFRHQLREAFLQVLFHDPTAVITVRLLGAILTRIYPNDQELIDLWRDVRRNNPAQVDPDPGTDPCADPCNPATCPSCPDPPPPPPQPIDPSWCVVNICDKKLDEDTCIRKNCLSLEFEFNKTSCINTCRQTYADCIIACLGGGPKEDKPKEPISPDPEPTTP